MSVQLEHLITCGKHDSSCWQDHSLSAADVLFSYQEVGVTNELIHSWKLVSVNQIVHVKAVVWPSSQIIDLTSKPRSFESARISLNPFFGHMFRLISSGQIAIAAAENPFSLNLWLSCDKPTSAWTHRSAVPSRDAPFPAHVFTTTCAHVAIFINSKKGHVLNKRGPLEQRISKCLSL